MKKMIICISLSLIMFFVFILIKGNENKIVIPDAINYLLNYNGISNATINSLADYSELKVEINTSEISESEIEEYVALQMEMFSEIIPITDREEVRKGDVVYISYIVTQAGEIIDYVQSDNLIVGAGKYNEAIEHTLVGKKVGEPFSMSINMQDNSKDAVIYNITVESINYFKTYELTDEFVQKKFNVSSVKEYYKSCRDSMQHDRNAQEIKVAEEELIKNIIEHCEFCIDINEIATYSKKIVNEYEQFAYLYNMSITDYIEKVLNEDIDSFYEKCYNYGEYEIKKYLVIGAICDELNLVISYEQFEKKCEDLGYNDEQVKQDEYLDAQIQYQIMEQMVLDVFYNKD